MGQQPDSYEAPSIEEVDCDADVVVTASMVTLT